MKLRPKDIHRAESIKYLSLVPPTGNPERDLKTVFDAIGERGWSLIERSSSSPLSNWTTTFHLKIALEHGFWELPIRQQQATLWHELVHVEQRLDMGRHRFNIRWTMQPRWKWVLETQAYRESIRNLKAYGATKSEINIYIDNIISDLRNKYFLRILESSQMKTETRRILLLGAGDF